MNSTVWYSIMFGWLLCVVVVVGMLYRQVKEGDAQLGYDLELWRASEALDYDDEGPRAA